ncbi:MFS transporter [Rhodococcus sp. P1Y]|uniref:MFS transporter n=1 Tax=Rhodococcus sp. P1Y TaxID=1302308 RepID=UPI001F288AC0|nr:MFS transporter [Rhodococcus sp. P1Y]
MFDTNHSVVQGVRPAWTLTAVAVSTFLLLPDLTVVNGALADTRGDLDTSFADLQWVLDGYALGLAAFLLAGETLADRRGRRLVFILGLLVFGSASVACWLAVSTPMLVGARFVLGMGGAILFAVGPALIGQRLQDRRRRSMRPSNRLAKRSGLPRLVLSFTSKLAPGSAIRIPMLLSKECTRLTEAATSGWGPLQLLWNRQFFNAPR